MTDAGQPQQPSTSPSRRKQQRRRRSPGARAAELWRPVAPPDAPAPIRPAADPTSVLRSLGEPPLQGQGVIAEHYLAAVVEQAAGLATALAAASGLLATDDDEGEAAAGGPAGGAGPDETPDQPAE